MKNLYQTAFKLKELIKDNYLANNENISLEVEKAFLENFIEKAKLGHVITVQEMYESYQQNAFYLGAAWRTTSSWKGNKQEQLFYKLLKRHDWRKVKPRPHHPSKADAEAIEVSKKLT